MTALDADDVLFDDLCRPQDAVVAGGGCSAATQSDR
jgi:hypothetical protein